MKRESRIRNEIAALRGAFTDAGATEWAARNQALAKVAQMLGELDELAAREDKKPHQQQLVKAEQSAARVAFLLTTAWLQDPARVDIIGDGTNREYEKMRTAVAIILGRIVNSGTNDPVTLKFAQWIERLPHGTNGYRPSSFPAGAIDTTLVRSDQWATHRDQVWTWYRDSVNLDAAAAQSAEDTFGAEYSASMNDFRNSSTNTHTFLPTSQNMFSTPARSAASRDVHTAVFTDYRIRHTAGERAATKPRSPLRLLVDYPIVEDLEAHSDGTATQLWRVVSAWLGRLETALQATEFTHARDYVRALREASVDLDVQPTRNTPGRGTILDSPIDDAEPDGGVEFVEVLRAARALLADIETPAVAEAVDYLDSRAADAGTISPRASRLVVQAINAASAKLSRDRASQ